MRITLALLLLMLTAGPAAAHHREGHRPALAATGACYTAADGVREVNVATQFGTGDTAIRSAIATAKAGGCRLYFGASTFTYNRALDLGNLWTVCDAGARLRPTSGTDLALILRGAGGKLVGCNILSPATTRQDTPASNAVWIDGATNFLVDHVTTNAGIFAYGARTGRITSNRVDRSLADQIHVTRCSSDIDVSFNTLTNAGDDFIGLVSYVPDGCQVARINVHHNTLSAQTHGRGISCVGCRDSQINDNSITGSAGAGILVARESFWNTYGVANVQINRNVIRNPATIINHWANILVSCDGGGYAISNVTGTGNNLDRSKPGVRTESIGACVLAGVNVGWFYGN